MTFINARMRDVPHDLRSDRRMPSVRRPKRPDLAEAVFWNTSKERPQCPRYRHCLESHPRRDERPLSGSAIELINDLD